MAEKTGPSEEYKNLQRELEKARAENKKLLQDKLSAEALQVQVTRLEDMMAARFGESGADDIEEEEETPKPRNKWQERRAKDEAMLASRARIAELMDDSDADWMTDPRLETARGAWQAGNYESAEKMVKSALGVADNPELDALVQAKIQQMMKAGGKVDTGEGAGSGNTPTDLAELNQRMKDPAWWREHKDDIRKGLKSGAIKVV